MDLVAQMKKVRLAPTKGRRMKLFDWLLAVNPREFRERSGAGMRAAFTEDYARARARGRLTGVLFLTITDLLGRRA